MAGLFSFGLFAGAAGGLALVILAVIIAFPMRRIFKKWSVQRITTFSSVLCPILLCAPAFGFILAVAGNIVLLTGTEAQGFMAICVATAVASLTGFLIGRKAVLILFKNIQEQ